MLPNKDNNAGRKVLGRGLGALIPGKSATKARFFDCPVERIHATVGQPRRVFNEPAIAELAASIRENGVIQPLVVRENSNGDYQLIAGERRLRAARLAELNSVPVVIKDVTDEEAFELALIENIQRQDLNPLEEAEAYDRLMQSRGFTQEQLAARLGRSRSSIANTVRLLRLEAEVRPLVEAGELTEGAARALLGLPEAAQQGPLAEAAVAHQLSVRNIEAVVKLAKDGVPLDEAVDLVLGGGPVALAPELLAPIEAALEEVPDLEPEPDDADDAPGFADDGEVEQWTLDLKARFGAPVKMKVRGKRGSIQLFFKDRAELDALIARLTGAP